MGTEVPCLQRNLSACRHHPTAVAHQQHTTSKIRSRQNQILNEKNRIKGAIRCLFSTLRIRLLNDYFFRANHSATIFASSGGMTPAGIAPFPFLIIFSISPWAYFEPILFNAGPAPPCRLSP